MILPDATLEGARLRTDHIRKLVRNLNLMVQVLPRGLITVSIGVALFPDQAEDADKLIKVADAALHESKSTGRDRVCIKVTSIFALTASGIALSWSIQSSPGCSGCPNL